MKIKIFVTEEKWQDDRMQMTHFSLYDFDARQSGDYRANSNWLEFVQSIAVTKWQDTDGAYMVSGPKTIYRKCLFVK